MRNLIIFIICALLAACASGGGPAQVTRSQPQIAIPELSYQELRQEFKTLAGAVVSETDPLVVSYPNGTLFTDTALLPMPGGAGQLDAIASLIRQSGMNWSLKVRADAGEGAEYDALLAAQRVKVLQTYFQSVGVSLKKVAINAVPGPGVPLELHIIE